MKKNINCSKSLFKGVIILLLFSLGLNTHAQNKNDFWQHVAIGGGLGFSFGDGFFSGTIAPSAIYRFNPRFAMGLGLNYTYNEDKDFYRSSIIGGSLIGFYNPIREIQVSAEFEQLNVNRNYFNTVLDFDENYWYPALFLGAGYRSGNVTFGIRYDVLYDEDKSIQHQAWMPFVRFWF